MKPLEILQIIPKKTAEILGRKKGEKEISETATAEKLKAQTEQEKKDEIIAIQGFLRTINFVLKQVKEPIAHEINVFQKRLKKNSLEIKVIDLGNFFGILEQKIKLIQNSTQHKDQLLEAYKSLLEDKFSLEELLKEKMRDQEV